jgi:type I restriction enzyme M protein
MQFPERFRYGFTSETGKKADLMFLQHMIASLKNDGIMATVMPHGVLFRGGQEKVIREGIVEDDLIEAIIGLPSKLFYNVGIPACIIVINKRKPVCIKDRILFINADREYGEGRNQNYLRPEDIEKIVTVFHQKKEISKYSRIVDIKEIGEDDFNLNIRRYVDNSPDPEIEDVYAHLSGGISKREVELYNQEFEKFNFSPYFLLKEKDNSYLEFREDIEEKGKIKEIIEGNDSIKLAISNHEEKLIEWWNETKNEIENFHGNNNLWAFREKSINELKERLLPPGLLDEFKIAGVFVNWWEDLRYDFKTIVSAGWSKNLIEIERIKEKFFRAEMEKLEELESRIAEIEGEIDELLEEVEDWDEGEQGDKSVSKVIKYLKEMVKDLKTGQNLSALEEARKWEDLISRIENKDKELKRFNKELKDIENELEDRINRRIESLTEEETRELLLEKFYEAIKGQLYRYLNVEKKELIKIFENLWDKYKVSLLELRRARDEEVEKLDEFLMKLGYYNG